MRTFLLPLSLVVVALSSACSGEPEPPADGGTVVADGGESTEDAGTDAGSDVDAGTSADAGVDPFTVCEGDCRQTTLLVKLGGKQAGFDRVQFGYTSPAKSANNRWELHIEAHAGGNPACPTQSSPTPERTLILGAVPVPEDATPLTKATDKLAVTFFDYAGTVTGEPVVRADSATITPAAAVLCTECASNGGSTAGNFVAFELDAVVPGGTVTGHGFAEHCDTLDDL